MIKPLLIGLVTYIPGYAHIPILSRASFTNTEGTDSALYCYAVWLRHLVMAERNGLSTLPETVAELGPGDSLGIGLAAVLSGSDRYYAFDVIKYAHPQRNLVIFDELVELFRNRMRIPDEFQLPSVKPNLNSYDFPSHILTKERLSKSLDEARVKSIRDELTKLADGHERQRHVFYFAPWDDTATLKENSVDMIYSQAVLEHVDHLKYTYQILHRWLKPGGFMSHVIDYRCHGSADRWNGHWAYSDFIWKMIQGTRPYLLNRQPHSRHVDLLKETGFQIVYDDRITDTSGITRQQLSRRFRSLSDDELTTSLAFLQAVKDSQAVPREALSAAHIQSS
jgi:hypothetical protein